jgi:hypothetical protein
MKELRARRALLPIMLGFVATGMLFVSRLGIEVDEASIANGIYDHGGPLFSVHIGGAELPLMMMSYYGALKTWFYNLLFLLVRPRPISLRLPMLLIAAAAIWLFFELLYQTMGRRAAWIGAALLATDSSYMLLNMTDYGPVTLQFFLKLAALVLLVRFYRSGSERALAFGFFLIGLALWDKAVFLWILFGLGVALIAVFPREAWSCFTVRNAGIALAAAAVGALPLLIYNVRHPLETLRANAHVQSESALPKAAAVKTTMEGSILFGFLTAGEPGPTPGQPRHWYQSLSLDLSNATGQPHRNLILPALAISTLALLLLWRTPARRPMLFGLTACVGTWIPMALTAGAGAAAQHAVLLWPFHLMVIAAALARIPWRAAVAVTGLLCASNAALTNQYYADLLRNGPAVRWTDAFDELKQYLADSRSPRICIADWGIGETLNLLSEGEMPIYFPDMRTPATEDATIQWPRSVFVAHPRAIAMHPETRAELDARAAHDGYEDVPVATISDRNGRPTFEVFRFRKVHL